MLIRNDKKIISAIAAKDEKMLAFAVEKYSRLLWKIAASVLSSAASVWDVEECVADVFIDLWQHPEKYDPDKGKLSSWLALIARTKAIDRYRRIVRRREISLEETVAENLGYAESNAAYEEMEKRLFREERFSVERLRACMEELAEEDRELIVRRYYDDQKPAEIAAALDMKKKQVENRLYSVKQKLKKRMEEADGGRP